MKSTLSQIQADQMSENFARAFHIFVYGLVSDRMTEPSTVQIEKFFEKSLRSIFQTLNRIRV